MRDMELSCDAAEIKSLGEDSRADYAQTLLNLAAYRHNNFGGALAFGSDAGRRIKEVARMRPVKKYITAAAMVLCSALIVGCGANPVAVETPQQQHTEAPLVTPSVGEYASIDAYALDNMAKVTSIEYTNASLESAEAEVTDRDARDTVMLGEIDGLAPDAVLEAWTYTPWYRLDVDPSDVFLAGGGGVDGEWFSFEGSHYVYALRYSDGSYNVLHDAASGGDELVAYNGSAVQAMWDWYIDENGLDLPKYLLDWAAELGYDETAGNFPVHRTDGEGWYAYIPMTGWTLKLNEQDKWEWESVTGATFTVEATDETVDANGAVSSATEEDGTEVFVRTASADGVNIRVTARRPAGEANSVDTADVLRLMVACADVNTTVRNVNVTTK